MTEGFFRKYSPEGYEPLSAGTMPVRNINPLAIEVMMEVGYTVFNCSDIENNPSMSCFYNNY
jgi:protein-tyrosine-phosphatase